MGGPSKSEYGKQFSPKRSIMSVQQSRVYQDNVGYREYRRRLENWHSHDPFTWNYGRTSPPVGRSGRSSGRSSSSSSIEEVETVPRGPTCWRGREQEVQTPVEWQEDDNVALPKTPPPKSDERIRRKTAPPRMAQKKKAASIMGHPFLAYGTGFRGVETGDKRSYNVYAGGSGCPAALRAQKRREAEIRMRQEKIKKAPFKIKREQALFNERVARETDSWQTEYSSHFPAHSRQEYERNLSARKLGGIQFDT